MATARHSIFSWENVVSQSILVSEVVTRQLTCDVNRLMFCDRRSEVSGCDTRHNNELWQLFYTVNVCCILHSLRLKLQITFVYDTRAISIGMRDAN